MPNSYEHSYQHDLDNVIDASDAVLVIGTEKVDTTTLKDRSLNNNDAIIHGAMRASGYFDGGRIFDGNNDYLDCGYDSSLNITNHFTISQLVYPKASGNYLLTGKTYNGDIIGDDGFDLVTNNFRCTGFSDINHASTMSISLNSLNYIIWTYDNVTLRSYINGLLSTTWYDPGKSIILNTESVKIGGYPSLFPLNGFFIFNSINDNIKSETEVKQDFNTLARLPLYSHNFERYPNSDTSLTSVFPYTSGIITSGSFNKTDGLKCTSADTIIFSNNFEFDGSEYIKVEIDGVEYSGTTTVTQGTITATIAQGSNDITIDMGTGDVLQDIRVQFREEV